MVTLEPFPRKIGCKLISLPRRQLKADHFIIIKLRLFRHQEESQKLTQEFLLLDLKRAYSCTTAYSDSIAVFYLTPVTLTVVSDSISSPTTAATDIRPRV